MPLIVTKADLRSNVHRPAHLGAIMVKTFDAEGNVIGERLIVGLFTSVAYTQSPRHPYAAPQGRLSIAPASTRQPRRQGAAPNPRHLPRDELFQIATRSSSTSPGRPADGRSGSASRCSCAATPSSVSSPASSSCRATADTICASAPGDPRARLWGPSPRSTPSSPRRRWRACISSSPRRPAESRRGAARFERRSETPAALGGPSARGAYRPQARRRAWRCCAAIEAFPRAMRALQADPATWTSSMCWSSKLPLAMNSIARSRRTAELRLKLFIAGKPCRSPRSCRCSRIWASR